MSPEPHWSGRRPDQGGNGGTGGGGGGTTAGAPVVRGPYSFTYQTAGLTNGVAFYTPTIDDILIEAWIEVDTAFNGTTPHADISQFTGTSTPYGLWGWNGVTGFGIDLAQVDTLDAGGGPLTGANYVSGSAYNVSLADAAPGHIRKAPIRFTTADPLLLVVSTDGTKGGTAVGGTTGAGRIYIVTATPVTLS